VRYLGLKLKQGLLFLTAVGALSLALQVAPAQADPQQSVARTLARLSVSGPECSAPALSQPFAAWKDFNHYTPVPGQSGPDFSGSGWLLSNGANVTSATQDDGTTGSVLDLPSGSLAISPPVCVDLTYPTARMMVHNLSGGGGVHAFVSYAGASAWGKPRDAGSAHGKGISWALSAPIHLQPNHDPGWQLVRFGLVPDGSHDEYQIYNFYVDPYAKR
jgi:hypothetical protein